MARYTEEELEDAKQQVSKWSTLALVAEAIYYGVGNAEKLTRETLVGLIAVMKMGEEE